MRCLWFWGDFGQPVSWSSGLCSFVAGEFAWYVLPWNLLALVWCLVSVSVWRHLMSSCQLMFLGVRSSLESGFGLKSPASGYIAIVIAPNDHHRLDAAAYRERDLPARRAGEDRAEGQGRRDRGRSRRARELSHARRHPRRRGVPPRSRR